MRLVRWGWSEYETAALPGLGADVEVVAARGPDAPLEEADVLVVPSTTRLDAAAVRRLRRARLVITTTSGWDHLDLDALHAAGIPAARLPLARRDAVVETTLGMILSLTRRLGAFQEAARADRWERARLAAYGATLLGTVGVVGVGVIGARVADALDGMGARCLRCDPRLPAGAPFDELVEASDVVTLHCDLNEETRGLFDAATIRRLRSGAVLVNTARGALVDVEAAAGAVRDGHLAGLALDVFPREPASLARLADPRIVVTPHAAGWHPRLGEAIAEGVARAVEALRQGREIPWRIGVPRNLLR